MNLKHRKMRCDVLIVGGGGAALRAAIEAREQINNGTVVLVTKGKLGESGVTATACSDRMAFHATLPYTDPGGSDNWKYHADDIYRIGGLVSDANLAGVLAKNSGDAFAYLDSLGVPFVKRKDGRADQFVTDGSKYARACYTGPYTANHIEQALLRRFGELDIEALENTMITDLLVENGEIVGAIGVAEQPDVDDNWLATVFETSSVVIATGGSGECFETSAFPPGMTGDGYAIAFRAGAELVNMEFLQIGLCSTKTRLACSGSMMRAIPRIVNGKNREFLLNYLPDKSPAEIYDILFDKGASWPAMYGEPSVVIDIIVSYEMRENGPIYLDYSGNPEGFDVSILAEEKRRWYVETKGVNLGSPEIASSPLARLRAINPESIQWLKERGIDLAQGDKIEIAPAVQHFQGGIKIDEEAQSSVAGLFAAGEVAGGQHGAKRPGGNSLLDTQVFGKIAGRSAAARAKTASPREVIVDYSERWRGMLKGMGKISASEARANIKRISSRYASVIRTETGLNQALLELEEIKKMGINPDSNGLTFALETLNMLNVSEMIITSALQRRESRGCHMFFTKVGDLTPIDTDEKYRKYFVISRENGKIKVEPRKPIHINWLRGE